MEWIPVLTLRKGMGKVYHYPVCCANRAASGLLAGNRGLGRPAPDSTAYAHRDAHVVVNIHGGWENPADDERCIAVARDFFDALAPYANDGVYLNFLATDEGDRVWTAYGLNHDRLAEVKRKYDNANVRAKRRWRRFYVFRGNSNIKPA